jgi:alpha-L-fucosidase
LPDQAVEILKQIGSFMKENGETIYETRGGCVPPQAWGVTTQKGKKLYIHILHKVENGQIFLPLTTRSITKVVSYHSKAKMKIQQEEGGYRIFLPEQPDMVDFILCATLK